MKKFSVVLMSWLLMQAASAAECGDDVSAAVASSAGIGKFPVIAAACKPWPHDRNILLSAYAFGTDDEESKTLVVATLDATTRRVLSSYQIVVGEDASTHFGARSLTIDAAPYQLAQGVRAFGVRFASDARGASCPDGIWGDELTLFVADGKALRPVLQGMPMTHSQTRKGSFCSATPDVVFDEAKLTLGMSGASSHGYADLQVSARITQNGEGPAKTERYTLRYDGKEYLPAKQKPWWLLFFPLGS